MKVAGYICDYCQDSCDFSEDDIREEYLCPKCGRPMWYFSSYEIDEKTGLTIGDSWHDQLREIQSPAPFSKKSNSYSQTIPKCPTCSSTNLKKITTSSKVMNTVLWGIFGTKRHKTFHCNDCGYEW